MNNIEDEYLDLVDENDNVIGKKRRSDVYKENLNNIRVINAFLINEKGQIWIPRRSRDKRIFPSCLDMSVGGHVESGETYEEAFARETKEEINIDVSSVEYKELGAVTPKEGVFAFMKVYEIKYNEAPDYNKDDFVEYFWLTPKEVLEKIESGEKSKGDLPILIKHFFK